MIPKSGDVLRPMGAPPARFRRCSSPIAPPHRVDAKTRGCKGEQCGLSNSRYHHDHE